MVRFPSHGNRRRRFFRFIKQRNKNVVCFNFIHSTRLFEHCCPSPEGFIELMQRGAREREARYLRFTIQRLGDLIYIPHLLAHAVLIVYTGSPTILSRWDASNTSNQQVNLQTLDEYAFGVRRVRWREIFRKKGLWALREWVLTPSTRAQEIKDRLDKHWIYWQQHSPILLSSLHIETEVPVRLKVTAFPPYSHLNTVIRIKAPLVQGPLHK